MTSFETFESSFRGDIVTPDDADYDEAITRWSAGASRRAKIIAFVKDAEDVSAAIKYAKAEKLPIAIRGGGHSVAAASSSEDGLVIDLSRFLRGVTIDVGQKLAYVGGGALWETVDKTTIQHGLATVGGTVNHTGVGGLTLGGGYGYLSPSHGLVIDNLVQATMVVGDGTILTASNAENTDLFWAIRGGGSNFGVCTQFVLKLHEQRRTVYSGLMIFPAPLVEQLIKVTQEWWERGPSEKTAMFQVLAKGPPPEYCPAVVIIPFYNGTEAEGREVFKAFLDLNPMDQTKETPYELVNTFQNPNAMHGQNVYMRAVTQAKLKPEVMLSVFERVSEYSAPDSRFITVWEFLPSAKINSIPDDATAFNCRGTHINVVSVCLWDENSPEANKTGRDKVYKVTEMIAQAEEDAAESKNKSYANYVGDEIVDVDRTKKLFGSNYSRLQQIKKTYDPDVIFSKWFSIVPAA